MQHVLMLVMAALLLQAQKPDEKRNGLENFSKSLAIISNPNTNEAECAKALQQLDKPPEPAKVWTDIANDSKYPLERRRQCIFKLFERHISPRIKLSALGEILAGAKWLQDGDITIPHGPSGAIALDTSRKGTIYYISLLPTRDGNNPTWGIYLRTSKRVDPEALARALRGEKISPELREIRVWEYALSSISESKDGWLTTEIIRSMEGSESAKSESTKRLIFQQ